MSTRSGVVHDHFAERPWVDEPGLSTVVEMHHHVRVRRSVRTAVGEQHLTAHPEVDHHRVTAVERQQQILASTVGSHHGRVRQPVDQRLARGSAHDTLATDLDRR